MATTSLVKNLVAKQIVRNAPTFLPESTQLEVIMGSVAYGVNEDTSDFDVYGVCIPPKAMVFPHLAGEIEGFGKQKQRFEVWQEHHIYDNDAQGGAGREYDFQIYNIVKYFTLLMDNNPNMLDSLFVAERCILHMTPVGARIRENRKMFLHKGSWHRFKGYAYSQLHKARNKNPESGKRMELVEKYGYDVKFAYHIVRLLNEVEQILVEGDLDLERNREQLKSIRRGEWTLHEIETYFKQKESSLEKTYTDSKLPYGPDEAKIKNLLLECLEMHFGSLEGAVQVVEPAVKAMEEIREVLAKYDRQV